jgi:hypothetical protein
LSYRCPVPAAAKAPAAPVEASPRQDDVATRQLRILFVIQRLTIARFVVLLPALAARGHRIHLAFVTRRGFDSTASLAAAIPPRAQALVDELVAKFPNVTYGPAPVRAGGDGWQQVAWLVRGIADLAHSAHPRFADAAALRDRTEKRILKRLRKRDEIEPVSRRLAIRFGGKLAGAVDARRSRRLVKLARRLEQAIPTSSHVDEYVRDFDPDVVLATGTYRHVSEEVEFLKSARRLRIPAAVFVPSWDNLTNHGSLKFVPERVFVWNEAQVRDAVELHRIPRDRVRATGAHVFDPWFELRPSRTRGELCAEVGLDPAEPYVAYLCSSPNIVADRELAFVRDWIEALRSSESDRLRRLGVLVRPHPSIDERVSWEGVELGPNVAVWPRRGVHPAVEGTRADLFDTMFHSAAVVGINTTALIEAAILGKSVLTILVEGFVQESSLHFRYLLAENGGFLHVAEALPAHVDQLESVLAEDEVGAERRRRFVASFVRPAGVERAATPAGVRAIEELADVGVTGRRPLGTRLLRLVLAAGARLNAKHASRRTAAAR